MVVRALAIRPAIVVFPSLEIGISIFDCVKEHDQPSRFTLGDRRIGTVSTQVTYACAIGELLGGGDLPA